MKARTNALVFHGGGLCDCSNAFIRTFAQKLNAAYIFNTVYVGFHSFASLLLDENIVEWNDCMNDTAKLRSGGFFGTCRNVDLNEKDNLKKAIETCHEHNIGYVFVAGGDGSARQVAEIADEFLKEKVVFVFIMPLTIDGINGGKSLGLDQAVRKSVMEVNNFVSSTLNTWEGLKPGVAAVELQGRNRDDILANVTRKLNKYGGIQDFERKDIEIFVVPANYHVDKDVLAKRIREAEKPTLVLVSEGSDIKVEDIQGLSDRKTRTMKVGHVSQINGCTDAKDLKKIESICGNLLRIIKDPQYEGKPYSIQLGSFENVRAKPIDYYAKLNPRKNQKATLPEDLEGILKEFLPMP